MLPWYFPNVEARVRLPFCSFHSFLSLHSADASYLFQDAMWRSILQQFAKTSQELSMLDSAASCVQEFRVNLRTQIQKSVIFCLLFNSYVQEVFFRELDIVLQSIRMCYLSHSARVDRNALHSHQDFDTFDFCLKFSAKTKPEQVHERTMLNPHY